MATEVAKRSAEMDLPRVLAALLGIEEGQWTLNGSQVP
jgi:hypothetical protein